MVTKEHERIALVKIKKLIAGCGEESYIGKAFEGCLEIAESNIDNDWWDSMKSRADAAAAQAAIAAQYQRDAKDLHETVARYKEALEDTGKQLQEAKNEIRTLEGEREAIGTRLEDMELVVIRLKAKLYDMMEKEGK